jgi:hypothetical protein
MDQILPRQHRTRCECGNAAFLITTEKLYAAAVDAEGILVCQQQSEYIKTIACSKCGREYPEGDFKGVDF